MDITLPTMTAPVSAHADTLAAPDARPPTVRLARGVLVGRYIVIDCIGAGGMGRVYSAYDPELGRKVALKLLQPSQAPDDAHRVRLLREAQTMAQLSHPNICPVYDVGTFGEHVFFAMELIAGTTLRGWLKQQRRGWREILSAMQAVGQGVAAAHAAGIAHSDLKPENVMIGADDRPRVTDFGIARAAEVDDRAASTLASQADNPQVSQRTSSRTLLGTPAYMAPEQWRMHAADTRSDQFSFCVTTWEALYGERPFAVEALLRAEPRHLRPHPPSQPAPSWLRRVLTRGLSGRPEDRYATMDALLAELASGQARRRRAWAAAGAVGLALVVGGVAGARSWESQRRVDACEEAGASLRVEVWDEAARARLTSGLAAASLVGADQTAALVVPRIDAFAERWREVRVDACMTGDRRPLTCLADQRQRLAGLIDVLAEQRGQFQAQAVRLIAALPAPQTCADPALTRLPRIESFETLTLGAALRSELQQGELLAATGRLPEARARVEAARERARAAGLKALRDEATMRAGMIAEQAGEYAAAEALLREALVEAGAAGVDDVAVDAAIHLVLVVGRRLSRAGEAALIGEFAAALVRRIDQAERPRGARLLLNLAATRQGVGELREAQALLERAIDILRRELGAAHPDLALATDTLGGVLKLQGDYRGALATFASALKMGELLFGPDSTDVAATLSNMGYLHSLLGEHASALTQQQRSIGILERVVGPNHPDVGFARSNLATALLMSGAPEAALEEHKRAIEIANAALGTTHPNLATMRYDLAVVQFTLGDTMGAEVSLRRALSIWEASEGEAHPGFVVVLSALGDLALQSGRTQEALALSERAVRIAQRRQVPPDHHADALALHARAVWATRGDRRETLAIAEQAAAKFRAVGEVRAGALAELERWIRELPPVARARVHR